MIGGWTARDAALATELAYGTVRAQGTLDEIIAACLTRPIGELDLSILDLLRLGTYQLLRTRIPPHAAVSATVEPGPRDRLLPGLRAGERRASSGLRTRLELVV